MDSANRFTSTEIRYAMRSLESLLGGELTESLINDLELYDLRIKNDRAEFGLAEITFAIEKRFGSASPILLEGITKALSQRRS